MDDNYSYESVNKLLDLYRTAIEVLSIKNHPNFTIYIKKTQELLKRPEIQFIMESGDMEKKMEEQAKKAPPKPLQNQNPGNSQNSHNQNQQGQGDFDIFDMGSQQAQPLAQPQYKQPEIVARGRFELPTKDSASKAPALQVIFLLM
jgi:hypothetical protein